MKKILLTALGLLILTLNLVKAQTNTELQVNDAHRIKVVGVGSTTTFPNAAQVTIALRFIKPTLREAINDNQKTAKEVLGILKKYVPDTNEIKVSLISTDKAMRWNASLKKEVFEGFESTQKIIFTLHDLMQMQSFTEDVLKTKIYEIEQVSYFHTDAANFFKKAQELAVTDAIETTERLCRAGNMHMGKIVWMETNNSPTNAIHNAVRSYNFKTFNKGMRGEGVSSSGQLINYEVQVTMFTKID